MKTKFYIDDSLLIDALEKEYELSITSFYFLPKGDSAYVYIVKCSNTKTYFLKLYDNNTDGGKSRIKDLDTYLPVTREMYDRQLFTHLSYPYKNTSGNFSTHLGFATIILFNYIEGRTLEDDYPFSLEVNKNIAYTLARMHSTTPYLDLSSTRFETFDISYLDNLKKHLSYLERPTKSSNQYICSLKDYILPRKAVINNFVEGLLKYQLRSKQLLESGKLDMVVSHGDVWGGNLIMDDEDNLNLVDWESTIIAPAERDIRNYTDDYFDCFTEEYETSLGSKINLHADIFGYYLYNSHLANLTNWIQRILFEDNNAEQNENDLDCIMNHCMNRWPGVVDTLKNIDSLLQN